jgi:CelD/BcsL family acetyltransferase involved in cellulose biosynthesis
MAMSAATVPLGRVAVASTPAVDARALPWIETIIDRAAFAGLRDEWTQLLQASRSDNLFLTWEWLHTWWTHLSADRRLAILAVRRGTQLVAIAPFASTGRSRLGVSRLEFLGTGRVGSDYLDVIVRHGAEQDVTRSLARHLIRRGAAVDMRQVRLPASAASALARELCRSGCPMRATRTHRCPVIDLDGRSFEEYLGSLGSEHRYSFQRKLRKLETQHDLRFERVSSEERRRELLPVLFELHRLRWSERGGSDGLEGSGIREFHEELTRLALERGWLRLFVLWLGGSPAATRYGFRYGRLFYFYQSGFDPRYRKLSVGLVAMGLAIKSAIEEGAAEFDLLHGEEAYKFHWAKKTRRLGRVVALPNSPLGRLSWAVAGAVGAARGLRHEVSKRMAAGSSAAQGGGTDGAPTR